MTSNADPIGTLRKEHQVLLGTLRALEEELEYLDRRAASAIRERNGPVNQLIQLLVHDLTLHARKEDAALFPVLRVTVDFPLLWEAIAHQDEELDGRLQGLQEAWRQWTGAGWSNVLQARSEFLDQGFKLVQVLREHIYEEESFLLGYANRHLTAPEKEEIAQRMGKVEEDIETEQGNSLLPTQ